MDQRDKDDHQQDRRSSDPPVEVTNGWYASDHPRRFPTLTVVDEHIEPRPVDWALPIGLFLITVFTTLWAGGYQTNTKTSLGPWQFLLNDPAALLKGVPFAATLLGILVTHEFGHYFLSRIHRVPASLPLFIPGPPHFIGTFGAIIRMRGPILSRKALFDIGVAGPIAGFVIAVMALAIGLHLSKVVVNEATYGLHLGEPLLLQFMSWLVLGPLPDGYDVVLHPIGFAAWFGLFVTSLNLIPIGQLDGGHVAYALWGTRQRTMALAIVPILIVLGFFGWPGWFLWAGMASILGFAHPPVRDPEVALGRTRIWVGWSALAIFVLTFAPIPFSVY
ncbi:MAG TPA: site-2 protease family protein [Nitrospiraceae bacterium]|nr:site-2 protease family protein [Nitrospiraceae bacterium]